MGILQARRNINNAAFGLKETLAETALMDFVAGHSNAHGFGMSAENIAAHKKYAPSEIK